MRGRDGGHDPADVHRSARPRAGTAGGDGGGRGRAATLQVATPIATGIHQVDNRCIAANGDVFLTHSGARGQRVPVSVFRVPPEASAKTT